LKREEQQKLVKLRPGVTTSCELARCSRRRLNGAIAPIWRRSITGRRHLPSLAEANGRTMRWKSFLFKQARDMPINELPRRQ